MSPNKSGLRISKEEKDFLKKFPRVIGIDEVGRGCYAGPMVVCGYEITNKTLEQTDIKDSKQIPIKKRENLYSILSKHNHLKIEINPEEIDKQGLTKSFRNSISKIQKKFGSDAFYLVDGNLKFENKNVKSFIKGDDNHYSIACASIIAKVYRDRIMYKYAKTYPEYGFDTNVGYGTKQHREALLKYGVLPIHRKSYAPIKKLLKNEK